MQRINFAIPSHRRSDTITGKTLWMLESQWVEKRDITIFLSDHTDMVYYNAIQSRGYSCVNTNTKNVVDKFNAIHRFYPVGSRVVFVEDDIESLKQKGDGKNELLDFTALKPTAMQLFDFCETKGTALWGISSNANPFYMKKDGLSYGFKFIVANLFGFISTSDKFLEISQQMKSDYERTLLYFVRYGGVFRADGICAITKNYKNVGGLQDLAQRGELEALACKNLVRRFPHLVQINEKKSLISKYMELKLKTQRKNVITDWMAIQKQIDKELGCSISKVTQDSPQS